MTRSRRSGTCSASRRPCVSSRNNPDKLAALARAGSRSTAPSRCSTRPRPFTCTTSREVTFGSRAERHRPRRAPAGPPETVEYFEPYRAPGGAAPRLHGVVPDAARRLAMVSPSTRTSISRGVASASSSRWSRIRPGSAVRVQCDRRSSSAFRSAAAAAEEATGTRPCARSSITVRACVVFGAADDTGTWLLAHHAVCERTAASSTRTTPRIRNAAVRDGAGAFGVRTSRRVACRRVRVTRHGLVARPSRRTRRTIA